MKGLSNGVRFFAASFVLVSLAVLWPWDCAALAFGSGYGHGYSGHGSHHHHFGGHHGGHHTYRYYGGHGGHLGHGYPSRHFAPRLHHRGYDRHYGADRDYGAYRRPRVYGFTIRPQRPDYGPLNGKPLIDWSARDDERRAEEDAGARQRRPRRRY